LSRNKNKNCSQQKLLSSSFPLHIDPSEKENARRKREKGSLRAAENYNLSLGPEIIFLANSRRYKYKFLLIGHIMQGRNFS
jgi:hypothetical protein